MEKEMDLKLPELPDFDPYEVLDTLLLPYDYTPEKWYIQQKEKEEAERERRFRSKEASVGLVFLLPHLFSGIGK